MLIIIIIIDIFLFENNYVLSHIYLLWDYCNIFTLIYLNCSTKHYYISNNYKIYIMQSHNYISINLYNIRNNF